MIKILAKRPTPKALSQDRDSIPSCYNRPPSKFKNKFIDLRGEERGTWMIIDYLMAEDHPGLDPQDGYSNHFWSVECLKCGHSDIAEGRELRRANPRLCPICKERRKAARRVSKAFESVSKKVKRELLKQTREKAVILYDGGTSMKSLCLLFGVHRTTMGSWLRKAGRSPREDYFKRLSEGAMSDAERGAKNRARSKGYYNQKRLEKVERNPEKHICPQTGRLRLRPEIVAERRRAVNRKR